MKTIQSNILIIALLATIGLDARIRKKERLAAIISMSDGSIYQGNLEIIGSRPLTIVVFGEKRQRKILLSDIVLLEHIVEKKSLERPWTFKESGRIEKIYSEGSYPLFNFKSKITLVTGDVIEGHILSAAFTLRAKTGKAKIFLKRQIKGKLNDPLAAVVHISTIRFPDIKIQDAAT